MEMPKPGPRHAALEVFAGTWQGTDRLLPSQWTPEETVVEGRSVYRPALGGFAVTQDFLQSSGGAPTFEGHGVFRWDEAANTYRFYWFDSMGGTCEEFRGRAEGNVWTFVTENPNGHVRSLWEFQAPDRYRHELAISQDGENWSVMMEGMYRKVGD